MNIDDYDLECTCDVGPFASCLVCASSESSWRNLSLHDIEEAKKNKKERERLTEAMNVSSLALHYQKLSKMRNRS